MDRGAAAGQLLLLAACFLPPANLPSLLQPTLTLHNSLLVRLDQSGEVSVTVQASNGRSMVQDTQTVRVYGNQPANQSASGGVGSKDEKRRRKLGRVPLSFFWKVLHVLTTRGRQSGPKVHTPVWTTVGLTVSGHTRFSSDSAQTTSS